MSDVETTTSFGEAGLQSGSRPSQLFCVTLPYTDQESGRKKRHHYLFRTRSSATKALQAIVGWGVESKPSLDEARVDWRGYTDSLEDLIFELSQHLGYEIDNTLPARGELRTTYNAAVAAAQKRDGSGNTEPD